VPHGLVHERADVRRAQQRLARHAGEKRALAAYQRRLDERHPSPCCGQSGGKALTGAAATEDDDVALLG